MIQLIILSLIFIIGIILSFYFLHFYFKKLNLKLNQINFINDFHILIYSYYLDIRFSILLNKTEIEVDDITNYIFLNYSLLISSLINENNDELNDYLDIMNHGGTYSCDKIVLGKLPAHLPPAQTCYVENDRKAVMRDDFQYY